MNWNIPPIANQAPPSAPKYTFIIIIFCLIMALIPLYNLISPLEKNINLRVVMPLVFIFFAFALGFVYLLHRQALVSYSDWKNNTQQQWQTWCQTSITSLANVIFTPDKEGADVFLLNQEQRPLFPNKPRKLAQEALFNQQFLADIDKQLEIQCPNYRTYLSTIYLFDDKNTADKIEQYWQLKPILSPDYQYLFSDDNYQNEKTFLIITLQHQPQYSEFISFQLFSNHAELVNANSAGVNIERIMPITPETLDQAITDFIDYSGIANGHLFQTWITKTKQAVIEKIIIAYTQKEIAFNKNDPITSLDLFYSTPHPNAFLTYLSLISDIAIKTKTHQSLIHLNTENTGYAVYIKNRG